MKDNIRTRIQAAVLAAVATTAFFTGCSDKTTSSDYSSIIDTAPAITTTYTEESVPTITDTDVDTFSIKYKYWYDNPDVIESQEEKLDTSIIETSSLAGENLADLADLPIHTTPDGNKFILSGRSIVYLPSADYDLSVLRTSEGQRVYAAVNHADFVDAAQEYTEMLAAKDITPPKGIEERRIADSLAVEDKTVASNLAIYVNNFKTAHTTTAEGMINIASIFDTLTNLGYIDRYNRAAENTIIVSMITANDQVDVFFNFTEPTVKVSYSTDDDGTTLAADEIAYINNSLFFAPDALERTLGYDVEVYTDDGFINIVTDDYDLLQTEAIAEYDVVKQDLAQTPEASQPSVPTAPAPSNDGNASQPETTKTADGKYNIASTDLQNSDGTFTQNLGPGKCTVPSFVTDNSTIWSVETASKRNGQSNPSKIPYSAITLENAAEAFPYLGFIGYAPDYIEIMPTDDADRIATKVWNNLVGTEAERFFDYANSSPGQPGELMYAGASIDMPSHVFSSEQEYLDYWAAVEAQAAAARAAAAKSGENNPDGPGFSETPEEIREILAGW